MLKKSVPPFVAAMREMAELFAAEQPELDHLEETIASLLDQFYIKTATYSLDRWEQDFDLPSDPGLTIQQRRARIYAMINGRVPATVKNLENLVRRTMGEELVWIEEHPEDYSFTVYVQEEKLSELLGVSKAAIHAARPAHLDYKFIERLIRDARADLYAAGYGRIIYMQDEAVDMSSMYSRFYMAGMGRFIKITRGEVRVQ